MMKILINIWSKEKNKLLLMVALILSFLVMTNCIAGTMDIGSNVLLMKHGEQKHYKIYDNYTGEMEKELFQSPESLQKLKNFYEWLSTCGLFEYQCNNRQYVWIKSDSAAVSDSNDSIQVNEAFFKFNHIKVQEGELFSEKDFQLNTFDDTVPVLLGKEFTGLLNIGEEFTFSYMGAELKGKVKGILASGSSFMLRNEINLLDKHIILPSLNDIKSPETKQERSFQMKLYLDKAAGVIITDIPVRQLANMIERKCADLKLLPYGIEENSSYSFNIWGSMGEELRDVYFLFSIFVIVISLICFTMECQNHVLKLKRRYAIVYAHGFPRYQIFLAVGYCIYADAIIPMFISAAIDLLLFRNYIFYPYLLLFSLIMGSVSFMVCFITMKNEWYWSDTRGKKYGNNTY